MFGKVCIMLVSFRQLKLIKSPQTFQQFYCDDSKLSIDMIAFFQYINSKLMKKKDKKYVKKINKSNKNLKINFNMIITYE